MSTSSRPRSPSQEPRQPHLPLVVLGTISAIAVPAASAVVAALWSGGLIDPDPSGAVVGTLTSLLLPSLILCPIGLVIAAWGGGVRGVRTWTAVLLVGVPLLAIGCFFAAIWLGGLAGRPL